MQNKGFYNRLRLLMATGSVVSLIGGWALLAQADKPVTVQATGQTAVQAGTTQVAAASLYTATPSPTATVAASRATSATAAQSTNTATATATAVPPTATPTVVKVQSTMTLPSTFPPPRIRSGGS